MAVDLTMTEIASALKARIGAEKDMTAPVKRVWTDSRTAAAGDVFFALTGKRYDAHAFIADAYARGVRAFAVSRPDAVSSEVRKDSVIFEVTDTLRAYGDLAKYYRLKFNIPCVVITGSCGKTTVKELTAHLLGVRFSVLKNQGTENNLIGVPKTLFGLGAAHQAIVLEIGTSLPGEIARLAEIASPQVAAITQIGAAHLEGLGSLDGVRAEKLSLVPYVSRGGVIVVNGEDPLLAPLASGVHKVVRCGFSQNFEFTAENPWAHEKGSSFTLRGTQLGTDLLGRHNILNALVALAVAGSLGVEPDEAKKALAEFRGAPGRMSPRSIAGISFIDDSYNANPTSFRAALETLRDLKIHERKKGLVCGDMLELGAESETYHRQIGALIAAMTLDFVITAGPASRALADEAVRKGLDPRKIRSVNDSVEAGKLCREWAAPGDLVLVKGSRGMQMEKVFECFITSSIR